jgi:hypothetical protein
VQPPKSYRPILWRLLLLRSLPLLIAWMPLGLSVVSTGHRLPALYFYTLLGYILFACLTVWSSWDEYEILISGGFVSGPSAHSIFKRETFRLEDLDPASFGKRTFYQKINGWYVLRSKDGKKIRIEPYLYGKARVAEIHRELGAPQEEIV